MRLYVASRLAVWEELQPTQLAVVQDAGRDWAAWEYYYRTGGEPFYAKTYEMVCDLEIIVGRTELKQLFCFTLPFGNDHLRLDAGGWLDTMHPATRERARAKVAEYEPVIRAHLPVGIALTPL